MSTEEKQGLWTNANAKKSLIHSSFIDQLLEKSHWPLPFVAILVIIAEDIPTGTAIEDVISNISRDYFKAFIFQKLKPFIKSKEVNSFFQTS